MSRLLVNLVMGAARLGGASKRQLMLVLADHTNETSGACFPGIELLEIETEQSRRTILRGLAELEAVGLLTVNRKVDRRQRQRNSYQLNTEKLEAMQRASNRSDETSNNQIKTPSASSISDRVALLKEAKCAKSDMPYVPNSTPICAKSASPNRKKGNEREWEQKEALEPPPVGDLVLISPAVKNLQPSKHSVFKTSLEGYYLEMTGRPMPWGPADAKQLKNLLDACPWMQIADFALILRNRTVSDCAHSQRAYEWLPKATTYLSGPLDKYKGLQKGDFNGNASANENIAFKQGYLNRRTARRFDIEPDHIGRTVDARLATAERSGLGRANGPVHRGI